MRIRTPLRGREEVKDQQLDHPQDMTERSHSAPAASGLVDQDQRCPWLRKSTVRRPKRLVVQPHADPRQLESVLVLDREIRRAFRELTSGSPAARQKRLKGSSIPSLDSHTTPVT